VEEAAQLASFPRRYSVNFVIVGKDEELPIGILNKGGWLDGALCAFKDFGVTDLSSILEIKSPNITVNKVPIDIFPLEFRNRFATIMDSSGDRETATAIIFVDGVDEFSCFGWSIGACISGMGSFSVGPSVVPSFGDNIDFFPSVLANVGSPELICIWVKGEAPRITEAEGKDLGMMAGFFEKGIVGRKTIGTVTGAGVHVDTEDLAVVNEGVLRKALWVVCFSAVTDCDVKIAVRAKDDVSGVMIPEGLRDF
jgi:hypothetical protein